MELRLNKEGLQYVLGLPVKDKPPLFSQVIPSAGDLEWLSPEVIKTGFSSLDDAECAKVELRDHLVESPCIYQVCIKRVAGEQVRKS